MVWDQDKHDRLYTRYARQRYLKIGFVVLLLVLLASAMYWGSSRKEIVNCGRYGTWEAAQHDYDSGDPKYSRLDAGGLPGIACDKLYYRDNPMPR